MKFEKIDDNSISLTMSLDDLRARNLKVSDLSYGSAKAKLLLTELIKLADAEIGFKADAPLAIEAVPLKDGNIKLNITKVFNPDELDSRFSKFSPMKNERTVLDVFKLLENTFDKFEESLKASNVKGVEEVNHTGKLEITKEDELICIFEFENIDKASDACKNVNNFDYVSVFYKDEKNVKFYLVLSIVGNAPKDKITEFNKVCNTLAEYGKRAEGSLGMNQSYYEEHYKTIIKENAVEKLRAL